MTTSPDDLESDAECKADDPSAPGDSCAASEQVRLRSVYRESGGTIHFDWAAGRIAEALGDPKGTIWVDITDPQCAKNGEVERLFRDVFKFHPLAIEDALKETHLPRVDDWIEYLYIVFQSIDFDPVSDHLRTHEIDIFLGPNYLVTYHTEPLAFLDTDHRNIERDPENRLCHGPDHLLYHILDLAVAAFLPAIEHLDEAIDDAQEEVFDRPSPKTLQTIFRIKRSALKLQRILAPEREVLNRLARDVYKPVAEGHRVYFRDVYDHTVRVHDLTEGLRDLIAGALDTYLSAISNRTNDVMKTLTIVTVMFLPMTFLSGFFGMNYFAETLALTTAFPKKTMFVMTCLVMAAGFIAPWAWGRRRGWF